MKHWTLAIAFLFFMLIPAMVWGQEPTEEKPRPTGGLYIGAQATTNGLGFNLRYIAGKRLTLKAGVESLNLALAFPYNENDINFDTEFTYKTGGIFLMADFFYARSLYLSGGAILNNFQPHFEGVAASDFKYGDITIPASKVGDFGFHFEPELKISPYAGLGFRKFIGKAKMITYNLETGLYYMGQPNLTIEATGLLAPTANPVHGQKEFLENQFSVYKYYPVVKFAIAIRLF